jgi:hypothetical protein
MRLRWKDMGRMSGRNENPRRGRASLQVPRERKSGAMFDSVAARFTYCSIDTRRFGGS